jgi:electron transport complex protein RnfC
MPTDFHGGRSWPLTDFLYDSPIETLPAPSALAIPLWGGGTAAVSQGQAVAAHSVVGHDADGLPVFTPLAGTVSAVEDFTELAVRPARYNIARLTVRVAVNDGGAVPAPVFKPFPRYWELTRDELAGRLFEAGVMDLRGKTLATDIVFDGLDPEPPLSANLRLLIERPGELIEGMRIVMQLHGAVRARLAVPREQPALYALLRSMLASSVNLHAAAVPNRYPAGHPALLPASVGLPRGSAIYRMEDALRIRQAVAEGRPLTSTCATLWDQRSGQRRNAELPAGATIEAALGLAAGPYDDHSLVLGGMLSGTSVHSAGTPAGRGADGIMLLDAPRPRPRSACDNCGRCLAACPAGLNPAQIYRLERDGDSGAMRRLEPAACLDCGLCTYVCPAGLDLCQQARSAQRLVAEAG